MTPQVSDRHLFVAAVMIATCFICGASGCDRANKRRSPEFEAIRSLVTSGKYTEAKPKLEVFLKEKPEHPDASRAGLFLGKVNLALGDMDAAKKAFEMTATKYSGSLEDHKSRYKLAVIAMLEGNKEDAILRFGALADKPDGPLAAESMAMRKYLQAKDK